MLQRLDPHMLRAHFEAHRPSVLPLPVQTRALASVALILCHTPHDTHLCMIRRTTREDDRWSGHMALPGGRASELDPDSIAVAVRETHEEVGLTLDPDRQRLGQLDHLQLGHHGDTRQGVLHAHVFSMERAQLPRLIPEPREVAQAYWVSLAELYHPDAAMIHTLQLPEASSMQFPAIRYGDQVVWGLTYRLLYDFSQVIGEPLPLAMGEP